MLGCLDTPIAQRDFAGLIGVSDATVSELRARGVIKPGDTVRGWLLAYIEQLRKVASGRGDATGELTLARIRESNAKAAKAEIEAAQASGHLVDATAVEHAFREWIARACQAIDAAEQRIVDGIGSELGIKLEPKHVHDHLRTARADLAACHAELVRLVGPGSAAMDP